MKMDSFFPAINFHLLGIFQPTTAHDWPRTLHVLVSFHPSDFTMIRMSGPTEHGDQALNLFGPFPAVVEGTKKETSQNMYVDRCRGNA
jgi:hypothetical protein